MKHIVDSAELSPYVADIDALWKARNLANIELLRVKDTSTSFIASFWFSSEVELQKAILKQLTVEKAILSA
jgi:hypothetical protein